MSEITPNLRLPYIMPAQAQKHVTHNEAVRALDAIVQLSVLSRALNAPPTTPSEGDRYIIAPAASGAWSGQAGKIAAFQDASWAFYAAEAGWLAWVRDESVLYVYDAELWSHATNVAALLNPAALVGVNATADTTNRLAVSAPASLFNHAGSDHRQKINKAAAADTASQLYQTGFSGRAELGLTGDDDFHLKVSADGSTWKDAIVVDRETAVVSFPHGSLGAGPSNPWVGKLWAALGTSVTEQGFYTAPLATRLGATLVNLGVSGGHLSVPDTGGPGLEIYAAIADIPSNADLVTLEAGVNDFARASQLGSLGDTTTDTFHGALHAFAAAVLAPAPQRRLVFITPYGIDSGSGPDWNTPNSLGNTLAQFQQAVRDVARRFACPVIDIGADSGISAQTATLFLSDGVHLNTAGGERFAHVAYDRLLWVAAPIPQVSAPSLSPSPGSYVSAQTVTLSCATTGASIHYTLDGDTPTTASDVYGAPLDIGSTTIVKAIAAKSGMLDSTVTTATYSIDAGFSPASLSPAAWWDASDLSTLWQDTAATTPITSDGQAIARVDDKSGNGRHVSQSSSGARPLYRSDGTHSWFDFDGTDDKLALASPYTTPSGNWAIAYASRKAVADGEHSVITGEDSGNWLGDRVVDVSQPAMQANGSSTLGGGFSLASPLSDHVVVANVSGDTCTFYQDGVPGSAHSGITTLATHGMAFAMHQYQYGGRIYQLLFIPRALTTDEIEDLSAWLMLKAGV